MNIGDLVEDKYGYLALVMDQVGVTDRWIICYIHSGTRTGAWSYDLYHIN